MKKGLLTGLLAALLMPAAAQVFGGNPPSLRWKQLRTDTARIIFPEGLDSTAGRVASIVHRLAARRPLDLGQRVKQINIVLQNQTTIANGYVGLGPYRSEFFLTPAVNNFSLGSISWADQLALHEYRHVEQYNNFHHGASRLMKVLFGEDGYNLAINASIPDWFYEGDAVYQETVLTPQGRGRLPFFMNGFPALWQAGKNYSWMKLRNGSFKDYVPNHYQLGYLLVQHGYRQYGPGFWQQVTRDASAFRGLFYPFQRAVKKYSGKPYDVFRTEATQLFKSSTEQSFLPGQTLLKGSTRFIENYLFPYRAGDDSLIYLKTSYRRRPVFYVRTGQGEYRIRSRDLSTDNQYSYRNGKILYAAYESDPRWGWRDYSVIRVLDVATGIQKTLTHKTKYFTPDLSPDGTRVAAVENNSNGRSEIHLLDTETGERRQTIRSSEISLFTDPKFVNDRQLVTAVRLRDGRMCLALAETETGQLTRLTNPSYRVVGYPNVKDNVIYFTAGYGGNDDLFAVRLSDRKTYRLTKGSLGSYYVSAGNGKITWSAFTADGMELREMAADSARWEPMEDSEQEALAGQLSVPVTGSAPDWLDSVSMRSDLVSSRYRKGTRLLNFHSWRPYYSDPIFTYSLYGENVLNTLQTELYYIYNENERTHGTGFTTTYGSLFPFLQAGAEYNFDRSSELGSRIRRWNQLDARIGLNLPFSYAKGQTFRNINLGSYWVYRQDFNKGFYKDSLGNTSFTYLLHSFSASQQIETAVQQLFPRFAWSVSAAHRHAVTSVTGYQFIGSGALYLPGLKGNHHLVLTGAFQQRDTLSQVVFVNRFGYSRGYQGRYFSRMWRVSGNYHFPVWHPDWGVGNVLYLLRFRANAFYDFTKVYSRDKTQTRDQRTVGAELFVDTKWWNQYPLSFGIRVCRLLDQDQFDGFRGTRVEFVLPVSIIPR